MSKKSEGITLIRYGELQLFCPLRFEKNISMEELLNRILESDIIYSERYEKEVLDQFANEMHKFTESWNEEHGDFIHTRVVDYEDILDKEISLSEKRKGDLRIEVAMHEKKMDFKIVSTELESLQNRFDKMQAQYDQASQMYGVGFTDMQIRFLLKPLKVVLYNEEVVWLYPCLYVFSNYMTILKLEIPLVNVTIDALKNNRMDDYIQTAICIWDESVEDFWDIISIQRFYINKIEDNNIKFIATGDTFRHIILSDFDELPAQIENLSIEIKEDIFRIVSAPVPNIPASIRKNADELLKNYSWGSFHLKSVLKSTGGCLSFVDKEFLEYMVSTYLETTWINLNEEERDNLSYEVVRTIETNVEFAILIIILKKMNQHIDLWEKEYNDKELTEIKNEFAENVAFITSLQENCYGSVYEQVEAFEKRLPYYMKADLMQEKLDAVETILNIKESEKKEKFQDFIAIGEVLIAAIFGLPSIYDVIGIFRECFCFITYDIPIISQANVSVLTWLGLLVWLCWNLFEDFRNNIKMLKDKTMMFLQRIYHKDKEIT